MTTTSLRHTTFKAHFCQKSPPKKFRYKAHFFEVKIYLLKNEVILGWFKVTLLNFVNFCSTIFQKWRDCTSFWQIFGNFWRILAKLTEFALVEIVLVDRNEKRCYFLPFFRKYVFRTFAEFFWKISNLRHIFEDFGHQKVCLK